MRRQSHVRGIKFSVCFYLDHGALLYTLDFFLLSAAAALATAVLDLFILSAVTSLSAAVVYRAIMSTSEEIFNAFTSAADTFDPVVGAPTNANVEFICRAVAVLLESFHYHGKQDRFSGLIKLEAKYNSCLCHAFNRPEDIDVDDYELNMPSNIKN